MKNIKYGENKHNETRSSVFMHISVTYLRKHNCNEVSNWRHSVGSSSYLCQSRYGVGTGSSRQT